jgi:small multidrug resistance family-3 protein
MSVTPSLMLSGLAAVAEIGGVWPIGRGVREHRGLIWIGAGIAALAAYGFVATWQDDNHFGLLAAYGGSSWWDRWPGGWSPPAFAPTAST